MKNNGLGLTVDIAGCGFTGYIDHYVDYLGQARRYGVQPAVGDDGKLPEMGFFDHHLLSNARETEGLEPQAPPPVRVNVGSIIKHPFGRRFVVTARAVYMNGCAQLCLEPYRWWFWKRVTLWENELVFCKEFQPFIRPVPARMISAVHSLPDTSFPISDMSKPVSGGPGRADSRR